MREMDTSLQYGHLVHYRLEQTCYNNFYFTRKYNTLQTPRHFLLDKIICQHLYELVIAI